MSEPKPNHYWLAYFEDSGYSSQPLLWLDAVGVATKERKDAKRFDTAEECKEWIISLALPVITIFWPGLFRLRQSELVNGNPSKA